jgi:hypothetical protein
MNNKRLTMVKRSVHLGTSRFRDFLLVKMNDEHEAANQLASSEHHLHLKTLTPG